MRVNLDRSAQLYQIRGRVGRAQRQAYCYLMVPRTAELTDKAQRRLETFRQFSWAQAFRSLAGTSRSVAPANLLG